MNAAAIFRLLLIYGLTLPLAVLIGYAVANPLTKNSLFGLLSVPLVLVTPFLLRWHHFLLIACWNMSAVAFLLPGKPPFWMLLTAISLPISFVQYALNKKNMGIKAPQLFWPLIFIGFVTFMTAYIKGGIGFGSFGAGISGGKRYLGILAGILGFFALTRARIPKQQVRLHVSVFFLGSLTFAIANTVLLVSPAFYFLYWIFPPDTAGLELVGDELVATATSLSRLGGLGPAAVGVFCAMLAAYGLRGIFSNMLRLALFLVIMVIGLLAGFRSQLIFYIILLALQFFWEGLHRTRALPMSLLSLVVILCVSLPFVDKMPLSVQRSLSFLPLNVDPLARLDAQGSTEWRLEIWRRVLPEIPQHFWLGKGYAIDSHELELLTESIQRHGGDNRDVTILAGDYHSGPLSLIIPLGIWGVIGFGWFLIAGTTILYRHFRYGDPDFKTINTFFLTFFISKIIFYIFVFGSFYADLFVFTGIVGLSISLNGGVISEKKDELISSKSKNVALLAV